MLKTAHMLIFSGPELLSVFGSLFYYCHVCQVSWYEFYTSPREVPWKAKKHGYHVSKSHIQDINNGKGGCSCKTQTGKRHHGKRRGKSLSK